MPEGEIENEDARDAIDEWNALFVRYLDLLRATVEFHEFVYDVFSFATDSGWVWNDEAKNYHNLLTREVIRPSRQLTLRERVDRETHQRRLTGFPVHLRDGKITVQKFTEQMQERIKRIHTQQFALGERRIEYPNGFGQNQPVKNHVISVQHEFLQNFSEQIREGRLSHPQIRNPCRHVHEFQYPSV